MKKTALILSLFIALYMSTTAQSDQIQKVNGNLTAYNASLLSTGNGFTTNRFEDPITKDYDYYIQKSKNQRTAGLVLLGGGVLLSGIGLLVAANKNASFDDAATGGVIMGLGALAGLGSIPLMIMAHVNKNKAKLMLSKQKTGFGVPSNVSKDITGITMIMPVGK